MLTRLVARLILVLVLFAPVAILADDATAVSDQSGLQSSQSSPVSPQTGGLLQPASSTNSPLQSADASGSGTNQSATDQSLQQTGTADAAKLLVQGDADAPTQLNDTDNYSWLLSVLLVLLVAIAGTAVALVFQRPTVALS